MGTGAGTTGAFAGEYSELVERKMHFVDMITELQKKSEAWRIAMRKQAEGSGEIAAEIQKNDQAVRDARSRINELEREMRGADEERYHDAFFRFARHFREIDDTLTVGKTQRALSSTWGGSAYTDMLYNFGLSTPWQPWHGVRGRMPFGTFLGASLHPGWMIGKYFAEKLRPYALLGSGMPAYYETQDFSMKQQWAKAVQSIMPISPESLKFWHVTIPTFRNPKEYRAVETDADVWGTKGYELMEQLKAQKRMLEGALAGAADADKRRLQKELEKQEKIIGQEFDMLQRGYYRELVDRQTLPPNQLNDLATPMTDTYRSIFLKEKDSNAPDPHLFVDSSGHLLPGELQKSMEPDTGNMRIIPPTFHRSVIGTVPVERLEDYMLDMGVIAQKVPWLSWLARIPIAPAYYDFDAFEPNADRHGRTGFIRTHYAYHAQVGTVFGVAGLLSALPWIGEPLAQAVSQVPFLSPLSTDPATWGAKTMGRAGEYVEKGLTGASQMWMKYGATYEQMPLYRMGEGLPVAGVNYFSPYKYMDPNLVASLEGKYQYLIEPHETVTAYPHLADEFSRDMNITEQMAKRRQELSSFQHMSLAQLGGLIPIVGLSQMIPIAITGTPFFGDLRSMQALAVWWKEHLTPERGYRALTVSRAVVDEHIITKGLLQSCPRCSLMARGGAQCGNCGTYIPYR
jgi:hypothetical protein